MFRSNVPPANLPDGWHPRQLKDIARIYGGGRLGLTKSDYMDQGIPAYSAAGQDGYVDVVEGEEPSIILSSIGARCGKSFLANGPWATLANTQVITPDPEVADACYLIGLLDNEDYWNRSGSAQPFIKPSDVKGAWVPIPPLDEQRRIAEVLRSVDEAIAATNAVAVSMLRASKTMRHELLNVAPNGTISDLPPGWTVLPLEELATVERGKFSIRPRNDPRYFGGSTPFIQTGDITSAGDYITRHTQTLNELGVGVSRVFPVSTIMTTIAANIGDFAITTYPVACPDSVVGIEAKPDVEPFWLYSALTCFKIALDRAATQNAQKNINLQTLRPLQLPVPPRAIMMELAETLSAAADVARQAKAAVSNLMVLKQAVMSDLLSGRVRVSA